MARDPAVQELIDRVGIQSVDGQRGQMDTVGFASRAEQMDRVFLLCTDLAAPRNAEMIEAHPWMEGEAFRAGICPHDDYGYAGRLYPLLLSRIRAKRVILFGVFHKAKVFDCSDVLVFDSFSQWHGPHGPVQVSPLREEILERMPADEVLVDNDMQQVEHSVEAIVPWLQAYNPEVEIVSILVPYMDWETMDRLSSDLASALAGIFRENGWTFGEDVAILSSSDAVHYGDCDWGGQNYADFGVDITGYEKAVQRDLDLATNNLSGSIKPSDLRAFFEACVNPDDVFTYKITWCGRFSIPFGLNTASKLASELGEPPIEGFLLDYGTSVSEATLPLDSLSGMGLTAPNNLHHWVGYASLGYR